MSKSITSHIGLVLGAIASIASFSAPQASAANLGVANSFNGFIFGNANTQGGHAQGAVAVGGNWSGTAYEMMQYAPPQVPYPSVPGATNIGGYVAGSVTTSSFLRSDNGNEYYGVSNNGTMTAQSPYSVMSGATNSIFTSAYNYLSSMSSNLASYSGLTINTSDPNNITVDLSQNTLHGNLLVYNLNASSITGNKTLNFTNGNSGETIVINVTGNLSSWGWTLNYQYDNNVLWNFENATTINIDQRAFDGSILAVNATVNQAQNIEGNLIAQNWNDTGAPELHFGSQFMFSGNLPAVPEPRSALLFAAGLGLIMRRRTRLP